MLFRSMQSKFEEDKAQIAFGAEATMGEIQEDLVALNRKVEDDFNSKAHRAVTNFAKRIEILEQNSKARQMFNEDIANASSEAVLSRTEAGQAILNRMQETENQAREAQNQIGEQSQANKGGLPPTESDILDSRPAKMEAEQFQKEKEKQMEEQAMAQQQKMMQIQQQAILQKQMASSLQADPLAGNVQTPTMTSAAGGMQMGGLPAQMEEPAAVQGGQMGVAPPPKQASEIIQFALKKNRLYPVGNKKIASQSLEAVLKTGDQEHIKKVSLAIIKNFPEFHKESEEKKVSQQEASYVSISPKDRESCANCESFKVESRTCKKVDGKINASAWCKLHYPKSTYGA